MIIGGKTILEILTNPIFIVRDPISLTLPNLVNVYTLPWSAMAIEIVDLPIENGNFP